MTTVGWLVLIDVLVSACACTLFALALHWRDACRDARARLAVTREDAALEMQRVLEALIERYGHEAALVALDAAARAAPEAARPRPVRPSPMRSSTE